LQYKKQVASNKLIQVKKALIERVLFFIILNRKYSSANSEAIFLQKDL